MGTNTLSRISKVNATSARNKDTRLMNVDLRSLLYKSSMGIAITIKSLGIEEVNVDPSPTGHLAS